MTLSAFMFPDMNMDNFDATAYAQQGGFTRASINDDGSVTVWMSRARHEELLREMSIGIRSSLEEHIANTPYILDVEINSDFTFARIKVDRTGYNAVPVDFTPLSIWISAALYQEFAGIEPFCEVQVVDSFSGEVLSTERFPEDLDG